MAAVDPYAGDTFRSFSASYWKEDARNYSPNGAAMFGPQGGEATLVGNIDAIRSNAAARFFLGYGNVSPNWSVSSPGTFYLKRTPPVRHPRYPRLYCVSVAVDDFNLYPRPSYGANKLKSPSITLPSLPAGVTDGSYNTLYGTDLGYLTSYKKAKVTARFAPIPYKPMDDDDPTFNNQEWKRYCYIDQEPRSEVLSLTGFQQIFTEGSGFPTPTSLANPISNPMASTFPSEIGQVIVKSDLRVNWVNVPEEWIFYRDTASQVLTTYPRNILLGLGTVNATNWNGYLAGTLMLAGVKFLRKPWPLAAGTESQFNYDVEFAMSYFDPDKGYSKVAGVTTQLNRIAITGEPSDPRGHNCLPWRGSFQPGDINAGKWFGATYTGSTSGQGLFRTSEFSKLFAGVGNPY